MLIDPDADISGLWVWVSELFMWAEVEVSVATDSVLAGTAHTKSEGSRPSLQTAPAMLGGGRRPAGNRIQRCMLLLLWFLRCLTSLRYYTTT